MKKYDEYKPVQALWLQAIPLNWEFNQLRSVYLARNEKNSPIKMTEILSLSAKNGVQLYNDKQHEGGNRAKEDITKYNIAYAGDLIVNSMNVVSGSVSLSQYTGLISPVYYAFAVRNDKFNRYYFAYVFSIETFQRSLLPLGKGILMHESASGKLNTVRKRISLTSFNSVYLPVPPRTEQDRIVRFLDYKTAKIDKLIAGYRKQIELLEERKQTIIDNAITNGIDPDVPMKDSGVNWIGCVPEHWTEIRIKNLINEINKRSEKGEEPHLTMSQKYGLVTDEQFTQKRLLSEDYAGAKLCWKDDIVLNRLKAHLGVFAISPIHGVVSPDYTVIRINSKYILPKYALHLFKCDSFRVELKTRVRGIVEGFWRLYTDDFKAIRVCIPSIDEQSKILNYIDEQSSKINKAISGIQKQISLLQEYRTRLISDVVTGQVDVRDITIPDSEVNDNGGQY